MIGPLLHGYSVYIIVFLMQSLFVKQLWNDKKSPKFWQCCMLNIKPVKKLLHGADKSFVVTVTQNNAAPKWWCKTWS